MQGTEKYTTSSTESSLKTEIQVSIETFMNVWTICSHIYSDKGHFIKLPAVFLHSLNFRRERERIEALILSLHTSEGSESSFSEVKGNKEGWI
jgi:hypothetical protein